METSRTTIVTGAARGIGAAAAASFAAAGDQVFGIDLEVANAPQGVEMLRCDVSDEVALRGAIEHCVTKAGRIDVLVNNAGFRVEGDIVSTSLDDWERMLKINLTSVFLGCKAALPHMLALGRGAIVNVASMAALQPMRKRAAYCAAKAGVIGLTRQMALDYADKGVRVNAVCPGPTDTPFVSATLDRAADPAAARAAYCARQPMGRLGTSDEIAAAIVFLASDAASFMTGAILDVDGGSTLENAMGAPRQ
jgi:NAD(P)-dependent dehydrogenase (short-subunit alcohol dehydrogenase family)